MSNTLADIVNKIASQGNSPDVSFLKDNPEAQTMLLLALLSNNNQPKQAITPLSPPGDNLEKRKFDAFNSPSSPSPSLPSSSSPTKSTISNAPKKVGRKPLTSEEEDSDSPKSKRKAQNRAAQRAFRERKENHVRVLEERVQQLEQLISQQSDTNLLAENEKLKDIIKQLQDENAKLLGATASFDLPLSSQTEDGTRPQKLIRSSNSIADTSPISHFDSLSSAYSSSSKSRSNTPEANQAQLSIDDILSTDNLPSNTLIDHSELLGLSSDQFKLEDFFDQQKFSFTTDPSQFDFFYPLSHDITQVAPVPVQDEGTKHIDDVTKAWDKLSNHPRFDEIDMDDLCDKMTKKATCTEGYNHDKELEKLVDEYYPVV